MQESIWTGERTATAAHGEEYDEGISDGGAEREHCCYEIIFLDARCKLCSSYLAY